jgi:hypothetical protein
MQMGRAPVIISDDWIPISGIPWNSFAIQIKEAEVQHLHDILAERRVNAEEMGFEARKAWQEFCSPAVSLSRLLMVASKLAEHDYGFANKCVEFPNLFIKPFNRMVLRALRDWIRISKGH